MTHNLGTQLTATQYAEFRTALADTLPALRVQTISAGGKFVVNGNLSSDELDAIQALYDTHRTAQTNTAFDTLVYQTQQFNNKRAGRASTTMRSFIR